MTSPDYSKLAFVALGANLPSLYGTPLETLETVIHELVTLSPLPLLRSSFWQSEPLDCPPGSPVFTNAVVGIQPAEGKGALSFLHDLQLIENAFGRVRSGVVNEARVIDLDLICFRNEIHTTKELTLPHPRAHERLFVLAPLSDIAPDLGLPGQSENIKALAGKITDQPLYRIS